MRAMPCLALAALAVAAVPLAHGQSVSVNATITGEVVPGVYGQLVLGNRPPPPVVYAQPVIAEPPPVAAAAPVAPVYLHVPPGHAKNWAKHCHEYHACNRPVYFVKSAEYEPGYRPDHRHDDHGRHEDDRGDHDRDHEHGHHDD
ncbi:MAG TPA: hypothetical protein VED45_00580 [Steroidobacteraceae bacterium]|nr:hypothetical protein [Steroidobacteraceae bacterium]